MSREDNLPKRVSSPYSTGGGGVHFEHKVQAFFLLASILGFPPLKPFKGNAVKLKLQGRYQSYNTDDLIIFFEDTSRSSSGWKLLIQIKSDMSFTAGNSDFKEVIQAAWRDYNQEEIFLKNKDKIALVTGLLSKKDTSSFRKLLSHARESNSYDDFNQRLLTSGFANDDQRDLWKDIKSLISDIPATDKISEPNIRDFLRHFYLIILDFDPDGLLIQLTHSFIAEISDNDLSQVFATLIEYCAKKDYNAGLIVIEDLPPEIKDHFLGRKKIPISSLISEEIKVEKKQEDLMKFEVEQNLITAILLGAWSEDFDTDVKFVESISNLEYDKFKYVVREYYYENQEKITYTNRIWKLYNREHFINANAKKIFDSDIAHLLRLFTPVILETPYKKQIIDIFYGINFGYSKHLKHGISFALAYLAHNQEKFQNLGPNLVKNGVVKIFDELFNMEYWPIILVYENFSLNLIEISPESFINHLESNLFNSNNLTKSIICTSRTYDIEESVLASWVINSLKMLAWIEKYFERVVNIICEIHNNFKDEEIRKKCTDSLISFFLPLLPQTYATSDVRNRLLERMLNSKSEITIELIFNLIPVPGQIAIENIKPFFLKNSDSEFDSKPDSEQILQDYRNNQILLLNHAKKDISIISRMISILERLDPKIIDDIIDHLTMNTDEIKTVDEECVVWNNLNDLILKHKRHCKAKWSFPPAMINRLENLAKILLPEDRIIRFAKYFDNRDFDLYDESENFNELTQKLWEKRINIVNDFIKNENIDRLIQFCKFIENPDLLGRTVGSLSEFDFKIDDFQRLVYENDRKITFFIQGYIVSNLDKSGSNVFSEWDFSAWSSDNLLKFITSFPFIEATWSMIAHKFTRLETEYWQNVDNIFYLGQKTFKPAIDKLMLVNRFHSALRCLYFDLVYNKNSYQDNSVKILKNLLSTKEKSYPKSSYYFVKIIESLQNANDVNINELSDLELHYFDVLDSDFDVRAINIEKRLSKEPDYFCGFIRSIFKSDDLTKSAELNEPDTPSLAYAIGSVLWKWNVPPGMQDDGSFNEKNFDEWIKNTEILLKKSGHLKIGQQMIGAVLVNTPEAVDGFWINKVVAEHINKVENSEIRIGFRIRKVNERGFHWISPEATEEMGFAKFYTELAKKTRDEGFVYFAQTLDELANEYSNDAKEILKTSEKNLN